MSVNPFGHLLGPFGSYPSNEMFLQSEYKDLYSHFCSDPSLENASNFYDFLETNKAELGALAAQLNAGSVWTNTFSDLSHSLQSYVHGNSSSVLDILDASNTLRTSLNIDYPPEQIKKDFLRITDSFIAMPSPVVAKGISWVLTNPDYLSAITNKAYDPATCSTHALSVEKCIDAYLAAPNNPVAKANLVSSLEALENDF